MHKLSEHEFSGRALMATLLLPRNRLNSETLEALQILRSGYRNGHISASQRAQVHINAIVQS
jgi:hypothetical protein